MARRSTPKTTGRNAPREASAEEAPPTPRRRGKATSPKSPPSEAPIAEPSVADAFFPGGDDAVPEAPELDLEVTEPVKPRRGRQAKAKPPAPEAPAAIADTPAPAPEIEADAEAETANSEPDDLFVDAPATTAAPVDESAPPSPPAAHWDAATGSVTFDWAVIEQVASSEGVNQPMAKLLLAARAEGARSRWPF